MATKQAFVIMSFSDPVCGKAYNHCIRPACEARGLLVRRADELFGPTPIYDDIVREINDATVIIADISGRNANVFYELGMSHTLKRNRTVMITHDQHKETPFDIAHFRIIKYADSIDATTHLKEQIDKTLDLLLSDLLSVHLSEFDFTIDLLGKAGKHHDLYAFVGFAKYPAPLSPNDRFEAGGFTPEYGEGELQYSAWSALDTFVKLGFAFVESGRYVITELGRAFAERCSQRGIKCFFLNDHEFVPGFVRFKDRVKSPPHPCEPVPAPPAGPPAMPSEENILPQQPPITTPHSTTPATMPPAG